MTGNNDLDSQQQENQIEIPEPSKPSKEEVVEEGENHCPKSPTSPATTMAEIEQPQTEQIPIESSDNGGTNNKKGIGSISFSIWPPTQRTRDAVINRLIETLSSPSVLSKRYGVLPQDEASEAAKRIEEEAFTAAGSSASSDDDGIEILQVYSKDISRRMLDTVKSRSASATATPDTSPSVLDSKSEEEFAAASAVVGQSEESSTGGN